MSDTARQPAGQPTGGQFAPTSGSDAGLDLSPGREEFMASLTTDRERELAAVLLNPEFDSSGEFGGRDPFEAWEDDLRAGIGVGDDGYQFRRISNALNDYYESTTSPEAPGDRSGSAPTSEEVAAAVNERLGIKPEEGESQVEAFGWALGEKVSHEKALGLLVETALGMSQYDDTGAPNSGATSPKASGFLDTYKDDDGTEYVTPSVTYRSAGMSLSSVSRETYDITEAKGARAALDVAVWADSEYERILKVGRAPLGDPDTM